MKYLLNSLISVPLYAIFMYAYIHGIIDHSGITFKAQWWQPWQPDAIFHDNHHQYFHVNYGFNLFIWDKVGFPIATALESIFKNKNIFQIFTFSFMAQSERRIEFIRKTYFLAEVKDWMKCQLKFWLTILPNENQKIQTHTEAT